MMLTGINTEPNQYLQQAIMDKLAFTRTRTSRKTGEPADRVSHRGVVQIYGDRDNDDVIVIEVVGRDASYKAAGRVHRILQELLNEELDLDRDLLHPRSGSSAKLTRAVTEVHKLPAQA